MAEFKAKETNKPFIDEFEEKLKSIKSKHLSKDVTAEAKKSETEADNDRVKRQKLLINPRLREIVNMFDPEVANKEDKNSNNKIIINYKSNTYINNNINEVPRNYFNRVNKFSINYNDNIRLPSNTEGKAVKPVDVKDKIKELKLSILSDRGDNSNNYNIGRGVEYRLNSRERPISPQPSEGGYSKKESTITMKEDYHTSLERLNRFSPNHLLYGPYSPKKTTAEDDFFSMSPIKTTTANTKPNSNIRFITLDRENFYQTKKKEIANLLTLTNQNSGSRLQMKFWEEKKVNRFDSFSTRKPISVKVSDFKGFGGNSKFMPNATSRYDFTMKNDNYFSKNRFENGFRTNIRTTKNNLGPIKGFY
jgi:hypothetical protein